tara:strand:+ start:631 stop:1803 length:1173 start_codon:yes stop_codon:yes gene_type:complete
MYMSNNNNRRVRRRLDVPLNLTNYRKNAKNIYININSINVISSMNLYTNIPREIGSFTQLERFSLTGHRLTSLPKEIGLCTNLKKLVLSYNDLTSLPKEIGNLKKLEELKLNGNKLRTLPKEIGLCKNLKRIVLDENIIESLPKEIGDLKKLEKIYIRADVETVQNLTSLPKEIGLCKNLTDLYLARNNLTSIPKEIGDLKNLEFLGLTQNKLTSIPKEIGLCKKLKYLGLSWNNLTSLPKEIEDLPKLRILELYNNPKLKGISSELRKRGLNIKKNTNTKFINYKYYTNQLSTVTVKRKNLPRLPPNIRENIARKVNTKPKAKNEANKMNVARSSLKAYNNKQKVLTRRYINMLSPAVNKNFRNRVTIRKKIHNFSKTLKNISKNNENN